MDFTQLIDDLKMLEGLTLSSIRPGAELVIEKVDAEQGKILISSKNKRVQSRPLSEFQKLWDELCSSPAIHVDEVLHGSGSSRNQPETILANLPYIEWLKINNKKHISYVGKPTHSYGTIKRMANEQASEVSSKYLSSTTSALPLILVVAKDIASAAALLNSNLGKSPKAISEGMYEYMLPQVKLVLSNTNTTGIPCGTYCELHLADMGLDTCTVVIDGKKWRVFKSGDINAISPLE